MNEFQNKLIIKEEAYQSGFFAKIPNTEKRGSAFILTKGCNDDIIVNEFTTAKQIRKGRYTQLVEISTLPYIKDIQIDAPSKETYYSFRVFVKAVIQVNDPVTFYENKNIDVDVYFDHVFSMDVKKITRKYSILDYEGMDDELTQKLSSFNTVDESTGFRYQISAVDAIPGEKAEEYVRKHGTQKLDAMLKKNARDLATIFTSDYSEAIKTEVAEGKLTEIEAIQKIQEYNDIEFRNQISHMKERTNLVKELREEGLVTDKDARIHVAPVLDRMGNEKRIDKQFQQRNTLNIDQFFAEEEEK